ncbi:hypothetical protein GCM10011367_06620 [Marinicauda pacifica]|uniref:Uncharacterized protein n=1 Tax=Marinicauda pacifica TaxID=1133559 RepID=A0A4S2HE72_9PROT|nr:hypothetical protein [Marinicauda pacifica]TGY94324.1 hypothetical protein E5162_03355 [Marinicauda pacifica]GGE34885.1 hypothetical protein GCM10011367_06620 [Marinicauda pacifica]
MLWLTWQMWILLALALLGGGIVGWMARGRSDEAEPGAQAAPDKNKPAAAPSPAPAPKPEARQETKLETKAEPAKTASAGKVATPDHAKAETGAADKAADPVAVGPTAPVAPDKGAKTGTTAKPKPAAKPAAKPRAKPAAKTGSTGTKPVSADSGGDSDITQIKGLGPRAAEKLNEAGVTRLSHIAAWSDEDIDRYDAMIAGRGRIRRDDWVGQAKALTS